MTIEQLRWKKYPVLNDGHICLVDVMGDDTAIVQAARISYGRDTRVHEKAATSLGKEAFACLDGGEPEVQKAFSESKQEISKQDRNLIRYLLNHSHTTPFEMVEFKFRVRVPMDCWRQWIRHRTANVNEYSTRYTEAIDSFQTTAPNEWRLQATSNKQGSDGFLHEMKFEYAGCLAEQMSLTERLNHQTARETYEERVKHGIAKEQARKDLPLSTYTEAYWKCDLHNIFNFLRLRMDSHAQYEIRMYANAMAEIVKQVVPVAWEAFEDYVLYAKKFSRMEMEWLKTQLPFGVGGPKPDNMTDREWKEFMEKLA